MINPFSFLKSKRLKLPGFRGTGVTSEELPEMPPGYKLQTDGANWRFVIIANNHTSGGYGTAKYAANIAWYVHKNSEERLSLSWKDAVL